ncbi:MAG: universal stress protein [Acidimicrobiales bacterium]|jgi:nucleotide-binding universal stress UspA family protein
MFEKLLVPLDESEYAERVLDAASEVAAKFGSEVRVLHVLELGFVGRAGSVPLEGHDEVHKLVNDAVAELQSRGVKATGEVRAAQHGKVAVEICDEAREVGATAIVTGSRGLTDLEGFFLGSTTHKLLHLSHLPVLVIR